MTPEELEERRSSIGSSEAAAVLGVSPWKKPIDLWMEKVGLVELTDEETSRKRWGKLLERAVVEEAREVLELPFTRNAEGPRRRSFQAAAPFAFMTATPDGFRISRRGPRFAVEAKTSRNGKGFGDPWTDEIPVHYKAQAIHQAVVLDVPIVYVPTLIGGSDFRMYVVEPTEAQRLALVEAEAEFWKLVETEIAPDEISSEYVRKIHPTDDGSEKVATPSEVELVAAYRVVRSRREQWAGQEEELAVKIQAAIGDAKKLVGPGFRISFAKSKDSARTDWKSLAADYRRAFEELRKRLVSHTHRIGAGPKVSLEGWLLSVEDANRLIVDPATLESIHTETREGSRVFRPTFFDEEGENGNA